MKKLFFTIALALASSHCAMASPGYYLISTYENEGEKTIDFKLWSVKFPQQPAITSPEIGIGYGVTKRWYTELYLSYLSIDGRGTSLSDLSWQNDYLLTQGQYPFDLAMHATLKKYRQSDDGYGLEFGPVLQTDFGRTQVNAGAFLERDYRTARSNTMQMKYQWQAKYRWQPKLHVGLQGFGELGDWDHWAPRRLQSHRIGPMIAGAWPVNDTQSVSYEASYLIGQIFAQHAKTFSMRVQYAF